VATATIIDVRLVHETRLGYERLSEAPRISAIGPIRTTGRNLDLVSQDNLASYELARNALPASRCLAREQTLRGVMSSVASTVRLEWRGPFTDTEVNQLHAEAFNTRVFDDSELKWRELVERHSLGWVTARNATDLVGFVNVVWDGSAHAWIQDLMVRNDSRRQGIGVRLAHETRLRSRSAGCEWLHVDFDDHLRDFYYDACGFERSNAGLINLS